MSPKRQLIKDQKIGKTYVPSGVENQVEREREREREKERKREREVPRGFHFIVH